MHDQQRSSPQGRPQYQPGLSYPTPSHLHPDEGLSHSAPVTSPMRQSPRNALPTRSSTMDAPQDRDKRDLLDSLPSHPASDHGHGSSDYAQAHVHVQTTGSSYPSSKGGPSSAHYSEDQSRSVASHGTVNTSTSITSQSSNTSVTTMSAQPCSACGLPMSGQFVRALGSVYHLDCFRCRDCNTVVAQKFFPIEGQDGKQHPLCERDYFKRLNLICGSCGMALRASYITACGKKFHVEHFTCSVCPTLFGPQDSYYEHEGNVYCHFHYSTRFATKCVGCGSAILKQFVEINRNMRDECWHPECYMIHKFWSVKLALRRTGDADDSSQPSYVLEEQQETAESLKEAQVKMEQQVYRIWTVLSAFEESSAACISDMLRHVSNGQYLEAIRMAEKFILHVEVLFATIDDLETHFSRLNAKGMSHVREARMLCRKTVDLFTLLSHTQETGERRIGMTQELLALVTGLAHYLKILIRIALTGALKLEREYDQQKAIIDFLDPLQALASNRGNPAARRIKAEQAAQDRAKWSGSAGTQGVSYGYKSLAPENAGETPFSPQAKDGVGKNISPPSDLCLECKQTVEEDCVRLGTYRRWHSTCVKCKTCSKVAAVPVPPKEPQAPKDDEEKEKEKEKEKPKLSTVRRPPANVDDFVFEPAPLKEGATPSEIAVAAIFCVEHRHAGCERGFQAVSRLEQYAFLLNVALRRLYLLLKRRGVMPVSNATTTATPGTEQTGPVHDAYRDSSDIMRMKSSVALDRKLSATARLPKRSTIVESPTGRIAQPTNVSQSQRAAEPTKVYQQQQPVIYQTPATPVLRQPQPRNAASTSLIQPQQPQGQPGILGWQQQQQSPAGSGSPSSPVVNDPNDQTFRPSFARNNTQVYVVDEQSAPTSPSQEESPRSEEGLTLADIPQLVEVEQAREQHRSLPRQGGKPLIAELSPLELAIIKHASVLALYRSSLKDQFDLEEILEMVETKKSGFWGKLFKSGADKKNVKKKGVFGVPLELLVERQGADSMLGISRASLRVPSFIDDIVSAMRQMDLSVEGIFRRNGNIRRLKDLTEAIDRDPQSVDLTQENAVQLAALLKKFLRDLPDPLMTTKLHRLFVASQMMSSEVDRTRYLHYISIILPKPNRDTMEVLFVFLKWVASFAHVDEETGSKMDLQNLATVICPSILWGKGRDVAHSESVMAIPVVTELLVNQDDFWQVPDEFLPILHDQEYFANSMDLPSKEFMKKCDTYMRVKANGRQTNAVGGLGSPVAHNGTGNSGTPMVPRGEGPDVRLILQRSDPALARGRPTASSPDPSKPPPNRYKQPESQSLERSANNQRIADQQWQPGSPSKGNLQHPGHVHQPYPQPPPPPVPKSSTPPSRQQSATASTAGRAISSDAEWSASQRPPPNTINQNRTRESGESSPTATNGRHSPPTGR